MSRITRKFEELKKQKSKALITFITAGDPSLSATEKIVYELEKNGADIVELGVPFSDSVADGPTIQRSYQRALKKNVTLSQILALVKKIRNKSQIPIVLMASYNLIFKYGVEKFCRDAVNSGVDGLIPPDLPPEEGKVLKKSAKACKLDTIFLVSPVSDEGRVANAAKLSSGFIYLVSLLGITGARQKLSDTIAASVKRIRKYTKKPVAVGFGISTPDQAQKVSKFAEGVIVGSAIIDRIEKNVASHFRMRRDVGKFVKELKCAI